MAARVFERQADMEQQREEWRVEVVKSKRKAIEVKKKLNYVSGLRGHLKQLRY